MPIDYATDIGKVRLLITDISDVPDRQLFTDVQIQTFLDMEVAVRLAAAQALEVIAASEVLVLKKIEILDLKTDGPAVSKELRELASRLRRLERDEGTDFEIAEMILTPAQWREKYGVNI